VQLLDVRIKLGVHEVRALRVRGTRLGSPRACDEAGFYCHTACDICVNESDCSSGHSCQYDSHNGIWDCFAVLCGG
jgi:hypothetical protein